jgi:hypothetical protein
MPTTVRSIGIWPWLDCEKVVVVVTQVTDKSAPYDVVWFSHDFTYRITVTTTRLLLHLTSKRRLGM